MPRKSNKDSELMEVYEDEAEETLNDDGFEGALKPTRMSGWIAGGKQRDKIIQKMLKYVNEFGVNSAASQGESVVGNFLVGNDCLAYLKKFTFLISENDDRVTRELLIQTSKYNIVPQKVVPLFANSIDDRSLATKCIILCNYLTYPMDQDATKALVEEIKLRKGKETKEEAETRFRIQRKAQINSYEQITALLSFKEALVTDGVFEALLAYVSPAVGKPSYMRTTKEIKIIERVLSLLSNLLAIDAGPLSPPNQIHLAKQLHTRLLILLQGEFLDMILLLCQSVRDEQNTAWVVLLVEICANILRGKDGRELFKLSQMQQQDHGHPGRNKASGNDHNSSITHGLGSISKWNADSHSSHHKPSSMYRTPATSTRRGSNPLLRDSEEQRRALGLSSVLAGGRGSERSGNSRFRGVYQVLSEPSDFLTASANTGELDDGGNVVGSMEGKAKAFGVRSRFLDGIHSTNINNLKYSMPQTQKRYTKKNLTFTKDDVKTRSVVEDRDEMEASRIIAGFVDRLLSGAFGELTQSVKEDWRRGDGLVGFQEEISFFKLSAICLRYYRMKLQEEQKKFDLATNGNRSPDSVVDISRAVSLLDSSVINSDSHHMKDNGVTDGLEDSNNLVSGWVPDIKNILQTLDRMSLKRAVAAIHRLQDNGPQKDLEQVYIPMEVYKELIAYLNLLLQSAEQAHHDIALASLYRIFYISQEKDDPLPQLLRDWRPGIYGRKHLAVLIELNHETMKVLEVANDRFRRMRQELDGLDEGNNKSKDAPATYDEHLEQYMISALRFDPSEYFRRLVNNHTVRLYTRVLDMHDTNAPWTNHYAFSFLQRLNSFKIESDHYHSYLQKSQDDDNNNNNAGEVTLGHMLFNIQTMITFDKILQSQMSKPQQDRTSEPLIRLIKIIVRRFGELARKNNLLFIECLFQHAHPQKFIAQDLEGVYEAHLYARDSSETRKPLRDVDGGRDNSDSEEEDWGDEFDENAPITGIGDTKTAKDSRRSVEHKTERKSKAAWSESEDKELRDLFRVHKGHAKTFENILAAKQIGPPRSKNLIAKRIRELKLYISNNSDDEDENEADEDGNSTTASDASPSGHAPPPSKREVGNTASGMHLTTKNSENGKGSSLLARSGIHDSRGKTFMVNTAPLPKEPRALWEEDDDDDDGRWAALDDLGKRRLESSKSSYASRKLQKLSSSSSPTLEDADETEALFDKSVKENIFMDRARKENRRIADSDDD